MALPPKTVYTRRAEMIEAAGYKPSEVPANAFDETGFDVLLIDPDGRPVIDADRFVTKHIDWPDYATSLRARRAMLEDFAEMIGMTPEAWSQEEARLRGLTSPDVPISKDEK